MKKEIKELSKLLKVVEPSKKRRAAQIVFLAVVCLGKNFDEVSAYFKIPYNDVRNAVTVMATALKMKPNFKAKMIKVARLYAMEKEINNQLKEVA